MNCPDPHATPRACRLIPSSGIIDTHNRRRALSRVAEGPARRCHDNLPTQGRQGANSGQVFLRDKGHSLRSSLEATRSSESIMSGLFAVPADDPEMPVTDRTMPPPTSPSRGGATAVADAPWTRATRRAELDKLLAERILVLDGAMGTLLQRTAFDEADFRGERFRRSPARPARRQRPARPDPARRRPGIHARVPRCRRRHHQHQLVHVDPHRPGRLRASTRTSCAR